MQILQHPIISPDEKSSALRIPSQASSNLAIDNPQIEVFKLPKSENGTTEITTNGTALLNGPSVATDVPRQHAKQEAAQNVPTSDGLYQPHARPSDEPRQLSSSPPGKLNGHSSPVRLPPPSTPNGYHNVRNNATGDSPVKHPPSSMTQTPAELITGVISGFSPTKHDSPRPSSACSISRTQVIPPVANLSPKASPMILTPPSKKMVSSPPPQVALSPDASKE